MKLHQAWFTSGLQSEVCRPRGEQGDSWRPKNFLQLYSAIDPLVYSKLTFTARSISLQYIILLPDRFQIDNCYYCYLWLLNDYC